MEINSKIHAEQLAPPGMQHGVQRQRSHKHDGQTDRRKNSTFLAAPDGGRNPSPTKLGMVIEDLEHVLAPLNLLEV